MSITNANVKASGEVTVSPLLPRKRGSSSVGSSLEKDAFKGHETINHSPGTGHGIDPSTHRATFETSGNESFYTPIEQYEGKHRYDPKFEWEPKEERKLVRKVCAHCDRMNKRVHPNTDIHTAGSPHLLLGLPHVFRSSARSR